MTKNKENAGFSLVELLIAMTILLVLLGLVTTLFSRALSTRARESRRTDALTSAQAALNVISREVANSGFGLNYNGIVTADCYPPATPPALPTCRQKLHFLSNIKNTDDLKAIATPGEDVTYFYDKATESIVRYDKFAVWDTATNKYLPQTSVIINRISDVEFRYFDYTPGIATPVEVTTPTDKTGRVTIKVTVSLEDVQGQPKSQKVKFESDVTLRNSTYMLNQY